ncbi:MAG: hypothetical protein Q8L48_26685 [Archangium sp.]|nr:hypothetical protein [Archangium sp.]
MNVRALTFGALIGFVVAFAPSCTPPKCGPQNCDGCCDSKGTCIKKPNNNNNTTCGSAGNACTDCAAASSTCNPTTSTCGTGTGAGGGGGGGATGGGGGTCDGCQLPMSGACVPLSRTSVINCGKDNVRCVACASGELCTDGACVVPPVNKSVGSACLNDGECQAALGATAICRQTTAAGNGTYQGGYCTFACSNATCPSGSTCVRVPTQFGEDPICWDNCSTADRCRTGGYACYNLSGGSQACWISPIPPQDAGTPADKVGNACAADGECQNPPEIGGACLTREFNYNWSGGYCTKLDCLESSECGTDGGQLCLELTAAGDSACVVKCANPGDGGQSTCRNGYICDSLFFSDGGLSPNGFCSPPPAPIPTSIGGACTVDMDCSIPAGAIADCFPPTLPDAGPSGFTGGYCTRFGCTVDGECGTNGACFGIGGTNTACFQTCPSSDGGQTTCRPGYVCNSFGLADGGQSLDGLCDRACNAVGAPACPTGQVCNMNTGYCD